MALEIPLSVPTVNAFVFFLIDLPALWAIQRGLHVLQATYYVRRCMRSGKTVQLVRTRVPIVGGDLLRGTNRGPNVFVVAYISTLVALFVATLGVEPDVEAVWKRTPFRNMTSLSMPTQSSTVFTSYDGLRNVTAALSFRGTSFDDRRCRTRNKTHANYWPVAFNGTYRETQDLNEWIADVASCQAKAPGMQPLFTLACVPVLGQEDCAIDDLGGEFIIQALPSVAKSYVTRPTEQTFVMERRFIDPRPKSSNFLPTKNTIVPGFINTTGFAYEFRFVNRTWANAIVLFRMGNSASWFVAGGWSNQTNFYLLRRPFRMIFHGASSIEYVKFALRTNRHMEQQMHSINDDSDGSTFEFADQYIRQIYRGVSVSLSTPAFVREEDRPITVLSSLSFIIYLCLIGLGLLMWPMKEIISHIFIRNGTLTESELFVYDYNQLSKNYRALVDATNRQSISGEFAEFGLSPLELELRNISK